jgi:hypothetical protein
MKKQLLYFLIIFSFVKIHAQSDDLWQKVNSVSISGKKASVSDSEKLYYKLNT